MKCDIVLAGVGGQGILSIATVIGLAAVSNNLYIKQAETHGMSQRGGAVQSFLRLSDKPIFSDLIPSGEAQLILSVEPLEALRYLNYLSNEGYVITNTSPFIDLPLQSLEQAIRDIFARKGAEIVAVNLSAFYTGRAFAEQKLNSIK